MKADTGTPAPASGILRFLRHESAGGAVLAVAALAALLVSNSPLRDAYTAFVRLPGTVDIGGLVVLAKPLAIWVNDLWMAVFFLVVGLEIKREFLVGELASAKQAALPAGAALGGMLVPAAIYAAWNLPAAGGSAEALRGWAIPSATDIAFAIGVVMALGRRVPASLRVFLTAVAIIDDLGAIVVIAVFYTSQLSLLALGSALAGLALLAALNRAGVTRADVYLVVGAMIWLAVLKSGVHATLAGVVTAMAIPMRGPGRSSPAQALEHGLHPWVAFGILPVFAFVNAGVDLSAATPADWMQPVTLGIAVGLVVGKAVGVFGAGWLMVRVGLAAAPAGASLPQWLGVSVLCGIGFTMSLFIGGLAFEAAEPAYDTRVKLGVLTGSVVSALVGCTILVLANRRRRR